MRKAFISPSKYVQGENELLNLGYYVSTFGKSALLIAHPADVERVKDKLDSTTEKYNVTFVESGFMGECSRQEVSRLQEIATANGCDCIVGLGGGKAIDAAKCVAQGEALIICPTIAATEMRRQVTRPFFILQKAPSTITPILNKARVSY